MTAINFRELLAQTRKEMLAQEMSTMETVPLAAGLKETPLIDNPKFLLTPNTFLPLEAYELPFPKIYYIPSFLNATDEAALTELIYQQPAQRWTQLKRRRLQNWGGIPVSSGMRPEPLPSFLLTLFDRIRELKILEAPNHVLLNEYQPGQGIMAHKDGPLYEPLVAIASLGSHCVMNFKPSLRAEPVFRVLVEPGSLLVFSGQAYEDYFHEIEELEVDELTPEMANGPPEPCQRPRSTRLSMTIRTVKKVLAEPLLTGSAQEDARRDDAFFNRSIDEK